MIYNVLRVLAWLLNHLFCRYRIDGLEHVPRTGPVLIVANHLSWYDPVLFIALMPRRIWFFTKIEMFQWIIIGLLCRATAQIPVQRGGSDRAALEKALAYFRQGRAVMIFPEGTVERQERMIPAHTGVAMLALRSGVPVLPIAHTGTRRVLRSLRSWFPPVHVQIGASYVPSLPEAVSRKAGLQLLVEELMGSIAAMLPPERRGVYGEQE